MPSDPAASVCLNMWSAGRGTLNGDNPRATWALGGFAARVGWKQGGFACGRCLHDLVIPSKTGLSHKGEGFGKGLQGFPRPRRILGVCGHFATFSGALAMKDSVFKVKVVKGKKQTKKPMHKKRKKVAFCTSENPGYSSLKLELPKQGFASGEALEALQSYGEPSFQSRRNSSGLSLGFVLLKELMKCPGLKKDAMKNLDLSFQRAVRGALSPYELLLSQRRKTRFDFRD